MKNPRQLQEALERYRRLCREIELRKYRLVGGRSFPVTRQQWEAWKNSQAQGKSVRISGTPPREPSDNPNYQRLLIAYEQLSDTWWDITGTPEFDEAERTLTKQVIDSFPSLQMVGKSAYPWATFYQILDQEKSIDPQAYYAARFVHALHWHGRGGQWKDRTFYIDKAFAVWDDAHKEAFLRWTTMPFFPLYGFYVSVSRNTSCVVG